MDGVRRWRRDTQAVTFLFVCPQQYVCQRTRVVVSSSHPGENCGSGIMCTRIDFSGAARFGVNLVGAPGASQVQLTEATFIIPSGSASAVPESSYNVSPVDRFCGTRNGGSSP
jgi:hypothetical protein